MTYYDRVLPITHGKELHGYGVTTYCKIIEYNSNDPINYRRTFAFGTTMKQWCLTAACRTAQPDHIYIDRVEAHNTCFIDDKPLEESTVKLVRLALYVMYIMTPTIDRFTLKDDSHIYCNGKDYGPKISLAYETIFKYNQTWYQQKFGAILDGFISQTPNINSVQPEDNIEHVIISISGINNLFRVRPRSMMSSYLKSLSILDSRCDVYDDIITSCPFIKDYETEYKIATSPRDFMKRIRNKFTKEQYCLNVINWLESYMNFLQIVIYYDSWHIPINNIQIPKGFKDNNMNNDRVKKLLVGGKTRKNYKKLRHQCLIRENNWGIVPFRKEIQGGAIPWDETY